MTAAQQYSTGGSVSDETWAVEQIEESVRQLESVPGAVRVLRSLATAHPKALFKAAAKLFESGLKGAAHRTLAELLARQAELFDHLLDQRTCSIHTAVRVVRHLLTIDSTVDFRLARLLPGRGDSSEDRNGSERKLTGTVAARALEILDQTSPGQRLLSLVGHLPNNSDPYISAKAALFVGRRVNNPSWVEKQLIREDPRVRANAIESVWGLKSDAAIRIMEECIDDPDNRVAGNALVGLHLAGCPEAIVKTIVMSMDDDPRRRAAAAWVMGKIGDPDFVDCLTTLIRDGNPRVRSTAVRSLGQISRAETKRLEDLCAAQPPDAETPDTEPALESVEPDPRTDEPGSLNIPVPSFNIPVPSFNIPVPTFNTRLDGAYGAGSREK